MFTTIKIRIVSIMYSNLFISEYLGGIIACTSFISAMCHHLITFNNLDYFNYTLNQFNRGEIPQLFKSIRNDSARGCM